MNIRIRCSREKVKELMSVLQRGYERGDIRGVKQISAVLRIHEGQKVKAVAAVLGITVQTVYNWLKAFLLEGCASFQLKHSPGRKPKLSKAQKNLAGTIWKVPIVTPLTMKALTSAISVLDIPNSCSTRTINPPQIMMAVIRRSRNNPGKTLPSLTPTLRRTC